MKKLSQKEKGEVVTKGYLQDQDFATKTYVSDMFEVFEKRIIEEFKQEFKNHTSALIEFHAHQTKIVMETLLLRIERIEAHVGLPSF